VPRSHAIVPSFGTGTLLVEVRARNANLPPDAGMANASSTIELLFVVASYCGVAGTKPVEQ
jgi:hypothetical protein